MRAVSTVLDVSLFLLLVSAAVGTLVLANPPEPTETDADETAELLASSTLSVEYDIRGETRRAHGTMGSLLARAATADASMNGRPLSSMDGSFRETVRTGVRERLAAPNRTRVVARWWPYRGAPLGGTVTVGPTPPPGTDVHTATVSVPAPVQDSAPAAVAAESAVGRYDAVARTVAAAVADGLLPENRVDASAVRESPTAIASAHRYRAVGRATDADVTGPLAAGAVETAHERAVDGLTAALAEDMREQFETPASAADAVRTGTVRITVRRWKA